MKITCLQCGHSRLGLMKGEPTSCPKCGSIKLRWGPCVEGQRGPEGPPGPDLRALEGETVCRQVERLSGEYWSTRPDIRLLVFAWLDEHALKCDTCAMVLEETAERGANHQRDKR